MIISRIEGGAGNQMFQYACGRAVSLASRQSFRLDLSDMKKDRLRDYVLDQFAINAEPLTRLERRAWSRHRHQPLARLLFPSARCVEVKEAGLPFAPEIKSISTPSYLFGYWQSENYFSDVAEVIRSDFQLKSEYTPARLETLSKIRAAETAVSVHVRRGDYVSNAKTNAIHGTCDPDWYAAALSEMASKFEDMQLFVFSDDISWTRDNLPSYPSMTFVEPQDDGKDVQDMHLMASCRAHVVANSSFSWWGAWLNPRQDKHVIAPAQWFRSSTHDARDLIPKSWQKL